MGEFNARDCGWSFGMTNDALADAVNVIERELRRPLTDGERAEMEAGHAEGVADAASYRRDMASNVPRWGTAPY